MKDRSVSGGMILSAIISSIAVLLDICLKRILLELVGINLKL